MKRAARFWALLAALGTLVILAAIFPVLSRLLHRNRPRFPYAVGTMTEEAYAVLASGANGNGWQASRLLIVFPG